jgi:tetratricopeptide (TPR) repeat protein
LPNFRAALAWLEENGHTNEVLKLAGALYSVWGLYDRREGAETLSRATSTTQDVAPVARAWALMAQSLLTATDEEALTLVEAAHTLFEQAGECLGVGVAHHRRGQILRARKDFTEAATSYERALPLFEEGGVRGWIALTTFELGQIALDLDDLDRAETLHGQAADLHLGAGDPWGSAISLEALARIAFARGDRRTAIERMLQALPFLQAIGSSREYVDWLMDAANIIASAVVPEQAARFLTSIDALAEQYGVGSLLRERERLNAEFTRIRDALGPDRFAIVTAGAEMAKLDQVMQEVESLLREQLLQSEVLQRQTSDS